MYGVYTILQGIPRFVLVGPSSRLCNASKDFGEVLVTAG